jgi:hypothetical protein
VLSLMAADFKALKLEFKCRNILSLRVARLMQSFLLVVGKNGFRFSQFQKDFFY